MSPPRDRSIFKKVAVLKLRRGHLRGRHEEGAAVVVAAGDRHLARHERAPQLGNAKLEALPQVLPELVHGVLVSVLLLLTVEEGGM